MRVGQSGTNQVPNSEVSGSKQTSRANSAAGPAKPSEKPEASSAASTGGAKAEISAKAKEFAKANEIAANAPDVREEKIAELRRRIAAGKYEVNPEAIADRMIDDHMQMARAAGA